MEQHELSRWASARSRSRTSKQWRGTMHEVVIAEDAWAEVRKSREIIEALADDQEPHYGVSTGFGALATRHIPIELRSQLQRSLVRSHAAGSGPEVERGGGAGLMLLRISTSPPAAPESASRPCGATSPCSTPASRPVVLRVRQPRLLRRPGPACPLRSGADGEGSSADRSRRSRADAPRRSPQPASHRSRWPRRRAWRLINGTDGMLGMLVLAIIDLRRLLKVADITAGDERRRSARHR